MENARLYNEVVDIRNKLSALKRDVRILQENQQRTSLNEEAYEESIRMLTQRANLLRTLMIEHIMSFFRLETLMRRFIYNEDDDLDTIVTQEFTSDDDDEEEIITIDNPQS